MAPEVYNVDVITQANIGSLNLYPTERKFAQALLDRGLVVGREIELSYTQVGENGELETIMKRPDFAIFNPKRHGQLAEEIFNAETNQVAITQGDPCWRLVELTEMWKLDPSKRQQKIAMDGSGIPNLILTRSNIESMNRSNTRSPKSLDQRRKSWLRMFGSNNLAGDIDDCKRRRLRTAESRMTLGERIGNMTFRHLTNLFARLYFERRRGMSLHDIYREFGHVAGTDLLQGVQSGEIPCLEHFSIGGGTLPDKPEKFIVPVKKRDHRNKFPLHRNSIHFIRMSEVRPELVLNERCVRCDMLAECKLRELLYQRCSVVITTPEIVQAQRRDQLRSLFFELNLIANSHLNLEAIPDQVEVARRFYGKEVGAETDFGYLKQLEILLEQDLVNLRGFEFVKAKVEDLQTQNFPPSLIRRELCIEWKKALALEATQANAQVYEDARNRLFGGRTDLSLSEMEVLKYDINKSKLLNFTTSPALFAQRWNGYTFQRSPFKESTIGFADRWSPRKVRKLIAKNSQRTTHNALRITHNA